MNSELANCQNAIFLVQETMCAAVILFTSLGGVGVSRRDIELI